MFIFSNCFCCSEKQPPQEEEKTPVGAKIRKAVSAEELEIILDRDTQQNPHLVNDESDTYVYQSTKNYRIQQTIIEVKEEEILLTQKLSEQSSENEKNGNHEKTEKQKYEKPEKKQQTIPQPLTSFETNKAQEVNLLKQQMEEKEYYVAFHAENQCQITQKEHEIKEQEILAIEKKIAIEAKIKEKVFLDAKNVENKQRDQTLLELERKVAEEERLRIHAQNQIELLHLERSFSVKKALQETSAIALKNKKLEEKMKASNIENERLRVETQLNLNKLQLKVKTTEKESEILRLQNEKALKLQLIAEQIVEKQKLETLKLRLEKERTDNSLLDQKLHAIKMQNENQELEKLQMEKENLLHEANEKIQHEMKLREEEKINEEKRENIRQKDEKDREVFQNEQKKEKKRLETRIMLETERHERELEMEQKRVLLAQKLLANALSEKSLMIEEEDEEDDDSTFTDDEEDNYSESDTLSCFIEHDVNEYNLVKLISDENEEDEENIEKQEKKEKKKKKKRNKRKSKSKKRRKRKSNFSITGDTDWDTIPTSKDSAPINLTLHSMPLTSSSVAFNSPIPAKNMLHKKSTSLSFQQPLENEEMYSKKKQKVKHKKASSNIVKIRLSAEQAIKLKKREQKKAKEQKNLSRSGFTIRVNHRLRLDDNRIGICKFKGRTLFGKATEDWVGIQVEYGDGEHDGSMYGKKYFRCRMGKGIMVRPYNVIEDLGGNVSLKISEEVIEGSAEIRELLGNCEQERIEEKKLENKKKVKKLKRIKSQSQTSNY